LNSGLECAGGAGIEVGNNLAEGACAP